MNAVANRYKRGELVGVGFEADFGGARCHVIAWANAQVERLRDDPVFTEGLIIDSFNLDAALGGPLVINVPAFHSKEAHEQAIESVKNLNREVVLVPCRDDFEENVALKARVKELEDQLKGPPVFSNPGEFVQLGKDDMVVDNPEVICTSPVFIPNDIVTGFPESVPSVSPSETQPEPVIVTTENADLVPTPEVIATHEPIEPTITETPVEPIQEPVAGVSELTASPPAQAVDTESRHDVGNDVGEASEVVEEEVAEAWKPIEGDSEAATIRSYFKQFGIATPHRDVISALSKFGINVTSSQVLLAKKAIKQ